jgi:hypothetical protein
LKIVSDLMLREFMQDGHGLLKSKEVFNFVTSLRPTILEKEVRCGHVATPVATTIESLLRGPMRISAPGDCNYALCQSSGAFAVQIGLTTNGSGDGRSATNSDDDDTRNDDADGDSTHSSGPSNESRSR